MITPGGVDEYIEKMPEGVSVRLREIRAVTREAAPRSTETVSYFQMPGYFYPGYDYNGMFAWFSFKPPFVRLHVRPPVLEDHQKDVRDYPTTKAIVSFPVNKAIPRALVKKLVKASIREMKQSKKESSANRNSYQRQLGLAGRVAQLERSGTRAWIERAALCSRCRA